jgi:hypothetical protein
MTEKKLYFKNFKKNYLKRNLQTRIDFMKHSKKHYFKKKLKSYLSTIQSVSFN